MKKTILLAWLILMVISFAGVALLCPSLAQYEAGFAQENYELIAKVDVPEEDKIYTSIIDAFPMKVGVETGSGPDIEIYINKNISKNQREYIKNHLFKQFHHVPEGNTATMELYLSGRLMVMKGEDWLLARAFSPFKQTYQAYSYIKILLPPNIVLDPNTR